MKTFRKVSSIIISILILNLSASMAFCENSDLKRTKEYSKAIALEEQGKAAKILIDRQEELKNILPFKFVGKSEMDQCYRGQNNWEVKSGYDVQCGHQINYYYGFNGDFKENLQKFDALLQSRQWTPKSSYTVTKILSNYYDRVGKTFQIKSNAGVKEDYYSVAEIPTPSYELNSDHLVLYTEYLGRDTKANHRWNNPDHLSLASLFMVSEQKSPGNIPALVEKSLVDFQYLIMLTMEKSYYETEPSSRNVFDKIPDE